MKRCRLLRLRLPDRTTTTSASLCTCQDGMRRSGPDEVVRMDDHLISLLLVLLQLLSGMVLHLATNVGIDARIVIHRLLSDDGNRETLTHHTVVVYVVFVDRFHWEKKNKLCLFLSLSLYLVPNFQLIQKAARHNVNTRNERELVDRPQQMPQH